MKVTLPPWAPRLRDHQGPAIDEIVEGFDAGYRVCLFDAPTGVGKTLIGDIVGQRVAGNRLYVCSGLELQAQVARDFPEHPVLKGRNNYPTELDADTTCDKCLGMECHWCETYESCPYNVAKRRAQNATCAVFNTSYLLAEGNRTARSVFGGRGLVIADECDMLEQELMRFTELRVGSRVWKDAEVAPPRKGQHYTTVKKKLEEELIPALDARRQQLSVVKGSTWAVDQLKRVNGALWSARFACETLTDGNWIREDYPGGLLMKPVQVGQWGDKYLWSRGDKWLCMSGTIISPDQLAEDLGLRDEEWFSVSAPMTFPVENRPVFLSPVADMSRATAERDLPRLIAAIKGIMAQHGDDRILIHAVSYWLTEKIAEAIKGTRPVWSYQNKAGRALAIERYRRHRRSVLVAPSLDRGVDFKDEDCRVVVVAKLPFPNLADPQINARLHTAGGNHWYTVQTVRTMVQMTGRGVRSETDHATSYVLDRQALRLWRESRALFPRWWREAVVTGHKIPTNTDN